MNLHKAIAFGGKIGTTRRALWHWMLSIIVALFFWLASAGGVSGFTVDDGGDTIPISNSFSLDVEGDSKNYLRSCTTQFPSEFGIAAIDGSQYDDKLYLSSHALYVASHATISPTRQSGDTRLDMSTGSFTEGRGYFGLLVFLLGIFGLLLTIPKEQKEAS